MSECLWAGGEIVWNERGSLLLLLYFELLGSLKEIPHRKKYDGGVIR